MFFAVVLTKKVHATHVACTPGLGYMTLTEGIYLTVILMLNITILSVSA